MKNWALSFNLFIVFSCCWVMGLGTTGCKNETSGTQDAGIQTDVQEEQRQSCSSDEQCNDGFFCTGEEKCVDGICQLGEAPDCDDNIACTRDRCSESLRECRSTPVDVDGDGFGAATCLNAMGVALGIDCDDNDANRFPGNPEVCDFEGHDEDCDLTTFGEVDLDGDNFFDARCYNGDGQPPSRGNDCNDSASNINTNATEACDGYDNDCDGRTDEGVSVTVYADEDGDGRGDPARSNASCPGLGNGVANSDDCNDADRNIFGGSSLSAAPEICDGLDNNCNGMVDEAGNQPVTWYIDVDMDGFGDASPGAPTQSSCSRPEGSWSIQNTDCDDNNGGRNPSQEELCNGRDDDCDGLKDHMIGAGNFEDDDDDNSADRMCTGGQDCDDNDATTSTGTQETCDGRDNDCDDRTDEGASSRVWYRDIDGDGYGSDVSGTQISCMPISGYVSRGGDCDDNPEDDIAARPSAADLNPDGTEICNGFNDDCDFSADESPADSECTSPNATNVCISGRCALVACAPGFKDCNDNQADGCETPGNSCGGMMMGGCPTGQCNRGDGMCVPTHPDGSCPCIFNHQDCNNNIFDGCEADLGSIDFCGSCQNNCRFRFQNVSSISCNNGQCEYASCSSGFSNCDGQTNNGCESNISSDPFNCGGCSTSAMSPHDCINNPTMNPNRFNATCAAGLCNIMADTCAPDHADCDPGSPGCEWLGGDSHCGFCGFSCDVAHTDGTCRTTPNGGPTPNRQCEVRSCESGWADCDGGYGCERNISDDPMNCGGCNQQCGAGALCVAGECDPIVGITMGDRHSCFLRQWGGVACAGADDNGQLGTTGGITTGAQIQAVLGLNNAIQITAGNDFNCAIREDQSVTCWGLNHRHQIANGTTSVVNTPSMVAGVTATTLSAGEAHVCALQPDRTVKCWGDNRQGQCGQDPLMFTDVTSPATVFLGATPLSNIAQIASGENHTCALQDLGSSFNIYCWGSNSQRQLGSASILPPTWAPINPSGMTLFTRIRKMVAGRNHTCVLFEDSRYSCWGTNNNFESDVTLTATAPVSASLGIPKQNPIAGATDVMVLANNTCFVRLGKLFCSGSNGLRQLGRNSTDTFASNNFQPISVPISALVTSLGRGTSASHACVGTANGDVWCWGNSNAGQTTFTDTSMRIDPPRLSTQLP